MAEEFEVIKKQVKENISILINQNKLEQAQSLLNQYVNMEKEDTEAFSLQAVISIIQGNLDEAETIIKRGLLIDNSYFDLLYNLAYILEMKQKYSEAGRIYSQLCSEQYSEEQRISSTEALQRIRTYNTIDIIEKKKIAFFVKAGMDSFIGEIIKGLSYEYETKKIIVSDLHQIDTEIQWADICWFEWCDELIIHASHLKIACEKKIICRLHSYEAFSDYPTQVRWENVDQVIFVAQHIKDFVIESTPTLSKDKAIVIPNGIDVEQYSFRERNPGFNIAYVGYINYKKGPMLLLHTFKAIYDKDHRYKLYIAGTFQDHRDVLYFKQMLHKLGIAANVFYEGWQDDINQWLDNKDYILCTSILESQGMGIMQAMSKGIKPLIHNFVGAETIYTEKYVWNTIEECVEAVKRNSYNSKEYRAYIKDHYDFDVQVSKIRTAIFTQLPQSSAIDKPLVTVGIINYNYAHYLDESIKSVLNQTYQKIDLLVIDDCSTDNSIEKLCNYEKEYSHVRVIYHEKNSGSAARAMREIIEYAKGDYFIVLSADDFLSNSLSIEKFVQGMLSSPDKDYIYCNLRIVDKDGQPKTSWVYEKYTKKEMIYAVFHRFGSGVVPITAGIFKRDFFTKNKLTWFDDKEDKIADFKNIAADTLNTIRYGNEGLQIDHLNDELMSYRHHANNMTYDLKNRIPSIISVIEYIIDNFSETIYFPDVKWSEYDVMQRMAVKTFLLGQYYYQVFDYYHSGGWQPWETSEQVLFSREEIDEWLQPLVKQMLYYLDKSSKVSTLFEKKILDLKHKIVQHDYVIKKINKKDHNRISQEDIVYDGLKLRTAILQKYKDVYKQKQNSILIFSPDNGAWKYSFQGWKSILEYMGAAVDIIYQPQDVLQNKQYNIFISIINPDYIEQISQSKTIATIPYKIALPGKEHFSPINSNNDLAVLDYLLGDHSYKFCITTASLTGIDYLFSDWINRGLKIYSNMFGFNPLIHFPEYVQKEYKYFFVGHNSYLKAEETQQYIGKIFSNYSGGLLRGTGWGDTVTEIHPDKVGYYYNRSAINLNYHLESQKKVECEVNERTYIINACGGFQLVDNPLYLGKLYSDKEIAIARDPQQYVELFEYYSNHSQERLEMAYLAMEKTYKNKSSLFHRMDDMLKLVEKYK